MSRYMFVIVLAILATSATSAANFETRAEHNMSDISYRFRIWDCFHDAKRKASNLRKIGSPEYWAVAWISMYSRKCIINETLLMQDKSTNNFPFRLNKELRCAFHPGRNPDVRIAFQKVGSLINESLSIMRPRMHYNTFRGYDGDFIYKKQLYFLEEGFFSTSKNINIALGFANGKTLMIVESMKGVNITEYVQHCFKRQQEVLPELKSVFEITKIVNNTNEINNVISKHQAKRNRKKPREIVYMRHVPATHNRINRNNLREAQRSMSTSYCDPV